MSDALSLLMFFTGLMAFAVMCVGVAYWVFNHGEGNPPVVVLPTDVVRTHRVVDESVYDWADDKDSGYTKDPNGVLLYHPSRNREPLKSVPDQESRDRAYAAVQQARSIQFGSSKVEDGEDA